MFEGIASEFTEERVRVREERVKDKGEERKPPVVVTEVSEEVPKVVGRVKIKETLEDKG